MWVRASLALGTFYGSSKLRQQSNHKAPKDTAKTLVSSALVLALCHHARPYRLEHEQRQTHNREIHDGGDDEHHVPASGGVLDDIGKGNEERRGLWRCRAG